jgi:hypothetical protein
MLQLADFDKLLLPMQTIYEKFSEEELLKAMQIDLARISILLKFQQNILFQVEAELEKFGLMQNIFIKEIENE